MSPGAARVADLLGDARGGSRRAVGRLLTLAERGGRAADEITELTHPLSGEAHVVGISGAPGTGKSTLTGALLAVLAGQGLSPGVLAVDPSSPLSGGAILGDRIRMDAPASQGSPPSQTAASGPLPGSTDPSHTSSGSASSSHAGAESGGAVGPAGHGGKAAFIRSLAARGSGGGLALAVPGCIRVLDACGFGPVIVETVGVGQVELDVAAVADTVVVVVNPGWGDAVQANKAGLLEVADVFVVNKADRAGASDARRDLELMLDLSHISGQEDRMGRRPPVLTTTATEGSGIAELWEAVVAHREHLVATGGLAERAGRRLRFEVRSMIKAVLDRRIEAAVDSLDVFSGVSPAGHAVRLAAELLTQR